ncbi:MAG: outer membrane usher protein [Candidatus Azotimanducaceae bacterium]|jgi:outer membrane usher protein
MFLAVGRYLILVVSLLCASTVRAAEPVPAIVEIHVNGVDEGPHFISIDGSNLLLEHGVVLATGLEQLLSDDSGINLADHLDQLEFTLDEARGLLEIKINPELLASQTLNVAAARTLEGTALADPIGFINFNLTTNQSSKLTDIPLELGINLNGWFFSSQQVVDQKGRWTRSRSQLIYDQADKLQRWTIGDFQANAAGAGGASLAGVNLASNFGMKPWLRTTPGLSMEGVLETTSEVELFIDGVSVSRQTLPPGPLNLEHPGMSGQSEVVLVITDAFGEVQRIEQDFNVSDSLLTPGLHDYEWGIGVPSNTTPEGINYSGPLTLAGHSRYGWSPNLTLGIAANINANSTNVAGSASLTLGAFSTAQLNLAYRKNEDRSGYRWSMDLSSRLGSFPMQVNVSGEEAGYGSGSTQSFFQSQSQAWRASLSTSLQLPWVGQISPRFKRSKAQDGSVLDELSFGWALALPLNIRLSTRASLKQEDRGPIEHRVSLRARTSLSERMQASSSLTLDNGAPQFSLNLQYKLGDRSSMQVRSNKSDQTTSLESSIRHNTKLGDVQARWREQGENQQYSASWQGSVVATSGGLHLGAPIHGGLAVVSVEGISGARVHLDRQFIGQTNRNGQLVVPNLRAFNDNLLRVEVDELPMGYSIDRASQTVVPPYKGGGSVAFKVVKLQAVEGRLFYKTDDEVESAQYSSVEVYVDDDTTLKSVTGFGGMLYLEQLQPGDYQARAYRKDKACDFEFTVPESEFPIVSVGDLTCEAASQP